MLGVGLRRFARLSVCLGWVLVTLALGLAAGCAIDQPSVDDRVATGVAATRQAEATIAAIVAATRQAETGATARAATLSSYETGMDATRQADALAEALRQTASAMPTSAPTATRIPEVPGTPTPLPSPAPLPTAALSSLDRFEAALAQALRQRDEAALLEMMSLNFNITNWQGASSNYINTDAVRQILQNQLSPLAVLQFEILSRQAAIQLLSGRDPWTMFPQSEVAGVILSRGWGSGGAGQALLVITRQAEGDYRWHSLLIAPQGFGPQAPQAAFMASVASDAVNLRAGPGVLFDRLAMYPAGTRLGVLQRAPGDEWLLVAAPDGQQGWMAAGLLNLDAGLANAPLSPIPDGYLLYGKVTDIRGRGINAVQVVASQGGQQQDAHTDLDGLFYIYLPRTSGGIWQVAIGAVACNSWIVNARCSYGGGFSDPQFARLPAAPFLNFIYSPANVPEPSYSGLEGFEQLLLQGLNQHNDGLLATLMNSPFQISLQPSGYATYSPAEAVSALNDQYLPASRAFLFKPATRKMLLSAFGTTDPKEITGKSNVVAILYSAGWGRRGAADALLVIVQNSDGSYGWDSVLIAPDGF